MRTVDVYGDIRVIIDYFFKCVDIPSSSAMLYNINANMHTQPVLSVVLPSYNNGAQVPRTVRSILRVCQDCEMIVVVDGSLDGSERAIRRLQKKYPLRVLIHPIRMGKGAAVRRGVLAARGEFIAFTDADLAIDPLYLQEFLAVAQRIRRVDGVIGYRSRYDTSFLRYCMHRAYHLLCVLLFHLPYRDTQVPLKLFRASTAKKLFSRLRTRGYAFDIELLTAAVDRRMRLLELPVEQMKTTSSMSWSLVFGMLRETFLLYHALTCQYLRRHGICLRMLLPSRHWLLCPLWLVGLASSLVRAPRVVCRYSIR